MRFKIEMKMRNSDWSCSRLPELKNGFDSREEAEKALYKSGLGCDGADVRIIEVK